MDDYLVEMQKRIVAEEEATGTLQSWADGLPLWLEAETEARVSQNERPLLYMS